MITGNKGEWSELYVLVSLLAEGKLYQADYHLNKDLNNVYELIKAYKSELDYNLEFCRNGNITVYKINDGASEEIGNFSKDDLLKISKLL